MNTFEQKKYLIMKYNEDGFDNDTIDKIDDLVDLTSKLTLKPSKIIFNPYINPNYSFIPICSQCSLDFENFKKNNNIEDNMEVEMKHSKSCLWADYFIIKIRNICNKVQIVRKIKRK